MRITLKTGLLALLLLSNLCGYAQNWFTIPLPDSINLVDITTDEDGFLYLIDRENLYIISGGKLEKLKSFPNALDFTQLTFNNNQVAIYPSLSTGYQEIEWPEHTLYHDLKVDSSVLCKLQNQYILSGQSVYYFNENEWHTLWSDNPSPLTNAIAYKDKMVLINKQGIFQYHIDLGLDTLSKFSNTKEVTATAIKDQNVYIADCDSIYKYDLPSGKKVQSAQLFSNKCITQLIVLEDRIVCLAGNNIYHLDSNFIITDNPQIEAREFEEWKALAGYHEDSYWVASDQRILLYTDIDIDDIHLSQAQNLTSSFYTIRNNNYITNGLFVFKFDSKSNQWKIDNTKRAPIKAITPDDGHPILVFNNHLMRIHKDNALILNYVPWPSNEKNQDVVFFENQILCATDQSVHRLNSIDYNAIAESPDSLLKFHLSSDNKLFISGANGIYELRGDSIAPHHRFQYKAIKTEWIDNLVMSLTRSHQMMVYNLATSEEYILSTPALDYQDFFVTKKYCILLNHKTLMFYDLEKFTEGDVKLIKSIPLNRKLGQAHILNADKSEVLLATTDRLIGIKIPENTVIREPQLKVLKRNNDSRVQVYHTQHWAEKPHFRYMLSGEKKQTSVWTNTDTFNIANTHSDYNSLIVELKDNMLPGTSKSAVLSLQSKVHFNYMYYIIALILIFAAGLTGLRLLRA